MTQARSSLIDPANTPYYHCVARCVRRAFLCGEDHLTGKNYEHRKSWVVERLKSLAGIFAIEVCAYAVMSNHYHVVLHINTTQGNEWSDKEVLRRWTSLFDGPVLVQQFLANKPIGKAARDKVSQFAELYRERLMSISWFMRCLNEYLARRANAEDDCKGRFWEGRFKSQALLDDAALLSCMVYVDLNPIRAGIASTPEQSDFTSLQQRIAQWKRGYHSNWLKPLQTAKRQKHHIPFSLADYFELSDWTGRAVRHGKHGTISRNMPSIFQRLGMNHHEWLKTMRPHGNRFFLGIGRRNSIERFAAKLGQCWLKGISNSRRLFSAV